MERTFDLCRHEGDQFLEGLDRFSNCVQILSIANNEAAALRLMRARGRDVAAMRPPHVIAHPKDFDYYGLEQTPAIVDEYRQAPIQVSVAKFKHDIDQLEYLVERGRISRRSIVDAVAAYREAIDELLKADPPESDIAEVDLNTATGAFALQILSKRVIERLKPAYNRPHYLPPEYYDEWAHARTLSSTIDFRAIERRYGRGEVVVIDNFLSGAALEAMRTIMHESTVWNKVYMGGCEHTSTRALWRRAQRREFDLRSKRGHA